MADYTVLEDLVNTEKQPSKSTLLHLPPNLTAFREDAFSLHTPITLSKADFDLYWPYIDNAYTHVQKRRTPEGFMQHYYNCRFYQAKNYVSKVTPGMRQRNRVMRTATGCPMRIKTVIGDFGEGIQVKIFRTETCKDHNHGLEEVDQAKKNTAVRSLADKEVSKGYKVSHVARNLQGMIREGNKKVLGDAGGSYLNLKDCHNAGANWKKDNKDPRYIGAKDSWQEQQSDAIDWLRSKNWYAEPIYAVRQLDSEDSYGFVFADPERLKILIKRGYLTLMDATHNTNYLGWFLLSLFVRTECGAWIPCAHIFIQRQDSAITGTGLCTIKRWCHGGWHLRFMLTDDSAAEQSAVKKAFQGLEDGEQIAEHLLCMKHSQGTLQKKLPGKKFKTSYNHMMTAMRTRRTKAGCEDSIESAIRHCPDDKKKAYLRKEWLPYTEMWAMHARNHSALLLQVSTTNPVESWHSSLKHETKPLMKRFSLKGMCIHAYSISFSWAQRARTAEADFRSKHLAETVHMPILRRFPLPVQQLVVSQLREAEILIEEGEACREFGDEAICDCFFYRKWQLPCKHIMQYEEMVGGILTEHNWEKWAFMFGDCGYEVYEGMQKEYIEKEIYEEIGAPARRKLDLREVLDGLLQRYYEFEEETAMWPAEQREQGIRGWLSRLDGVTGPLRREAVAQLRATLCPEGQQTVEDSQDAPTGALARSIACEEASEDDMYDSEEAEG